MASERPGKPNVVYFHVDNLGYGELGCYGGGILRGAATPRIDAFATEGYRLMNYAPEAQCTPSRTALLTGRYAIRTGNHTVALAGSESGIVAWERTLGDLFSDAGYATMCMGKWHIGDCEGRWPTDHGFDEWYGPPHSYDEAFWDVDPWYDPKRDPVSHMLEGRKGEKVRKAERLTYELKRSIDVEYKRRAFAFMEGAARESRPFLLYFNHSLMHMPVVPRDEYRGRSRNGDWADCLLQLDGDFGEILDKLDALGLRDNTIVVFAGDNGNEEMLLHRGTGGYFEGSYFTGMEASLRTPCIARWPGHIAANRTSNEIVHITDWFTTLLSLAGIATPNDREIDGKDQSAFLQGDQEHSSRDGFIFWNGAQMYGVKWQNFKMVMVEQKYLTNPALPLPSPHVINLVVDPQEREPINPAYIHSWTMAHFSRILREFHESVAREPLIPAGADLRHVPERADRPS
ncbi:arylsulfatase [Lysobacter soli]|uniref:arylsulfatase n=1 Tax=Lysobacter soli TaxID=453783 RepID=UPI0020A085A9|nr:arylsulfatase [Lysobacter soli]UTA53178.1 arylsulfatase [Lysobacter soli]